MRQDIEERADYAAVRVWMNNRSQTECARLLGTSQGRLSAWLRGKELSAPHMLAWSAATSIPAETFALAKLRAAA